MTTTRIHEPIDLLDGNLYAGDPEPVYAWLRENAPVYWDPINEIWGISRHRDVLEIEKNPQLYSSARGSRPNIEYPMTMINMDDPLHQNLRSMVNRQFTPRAVKQLEQRVRDVVTWLIDGVCEQGFCEVVRDLAAPLPAIMIGDKLGYPPELWPKLVYWSETTMQGGGGPRFSTVESRHASAEFGEVTWQLIQERRREPRDDLLSVWCHKEVALRALDGSDRIETRRMTDEEIIHEALLLLDGGAETTRTVIGSTVLELIRHPDQRALLVAEPWRIGATAVEEFIRWTTPILNMRRTVTADHELHGCTLRAGDQVLLMYSSANRDPEAFDRPDVYDVTREHNQHVAFGFGTHFCLGASLARLEIRVMFEELLRRIPDMRLAPWADPQIQPAAFARGLKSLRVEFTPSAPVSPQRAPNPPL
ncbi:MAG TPA: cytochrome P450 [Acidimicrobiales bacterium]